MPPAPMSPTISYGPRAVPAESVMSRGWSIQRRDRLRRSNVWWLSAWTHALPRCGRDVGHDAAIFEAEVVGVESSKGMLAVANREARLRKASPGYVPWRPCPRERDVRRSTRWVSGVLSLLASDQRDLPAATDDPADHRRLA